MESWIRSNLVTYLFQILNHAETTTPVWKIDTQPLSNSSSDGEENLLTQAASPFFLGGPGMDGGRLR